MKKEPSGSTFTPSPTIMRSGSWLKARGFKRSNKVSSAGWLGAPLEIELLPLHIRRAAEEALVSVPEPPECLPAKMLLVPLEGGVFYREVWVSLHRLLTLRPNPGQRRMGVLSCTSHSAAATLF